MKKRQTSLMFKRSHPTLGATRGVTWVQFDGVIVGSYSKMAEPLNGAKYVLQSSLLNGYFTSAWRVRAALQAIADERTPRLF